MLHTSNVIPQHHSELHLVWIPDDADANGHVSPHWIDEDTEQDEEQITIRALLPMQS